MFLLLTISPSIAVKSRSESVLNIWYQERVAYSIDMWKIYLQRTIDLTCFENGSRTITVSVMRQYASDWRIWYFIWILTFGVIYSQWCVTHVSLTLKTGNPLNKMASFTLKSNYKIKTPFHSQTETRHIDAENLAESFLCFENVL